MSSKVLPLRASAGASPGLGDDALARACGTRDPAAIAALFDRLHSVAAAFLSRIVGPGPDVEDLVQATFLVIARGESVFEGRSSARTWVLGIAANVARHHLRSRRRQRAFLEEAARLDAGSPPSPEAMAGTRAAIARARAALDALDEEERFAFVLCEIEGLSAAEAAVELGCSVAAVWKRVSRARGRIRRACEEGPS